MLGFLVVFVIALMAGWLPSYLTARFSTLTDPFQFESGTGYHISNSLLAIGNGGVFGKGLGNSAMKLGYLPEPHTDFIFAIICEELGLIGGLLVITLEFFIVYRAFQFANKTSSYFYKLVCWDCHILWKPNVCKHWRYFGNNSINWCAIAIYQFWWIIND